MIAQPLASQLLFFFCFLFFTFLFFFFFFYFLPTRVCGKKIMNFKNWLWYNKPLGFDGSNLNYYVLVVSWSYSKYLKGSIYHYNTVYQQRCVSCASQAQWFSYINTFMRNLWPENDGSNDEQRMWLFAIANIIIMLLLRFGRTQSNMCKLQNERLKWSLKWCTFTLP